MMQKDHDDRHTLNPRIKSVTQWLWATLAVIGLVVLCVGALRAQRMLASQGWPKIDGTVITSELQRGLLREGGLKYKCQIIYGYTVDGTVYQSERLYFGAPRPARQNARSLLARYPSGQSVSVHYNPANPSMAVLETKSSWQGFQGLVYGLLLTCLGVMGFWLRWPLQSDYLFRERDPDQPLTYRGIILGILGLLTWLGIAWLWWELIKMYAGR